MGHKARKPTRPPIPQFVIDAAKAEGVSPEVIEERLIQDLVRILRSPAPDES